MTVVQIRRALVVDDDFDFLTMQLISLKHCGFSDIVGAEDGNIALDHLSRHTRARPMTAARRRTCGRLGLERAEVFLPDRMPAYITWDQFQRNQEQIRSNRTSQLGPARSGTALLSGLIVCGQCGLRMTVSYNNAAHAARYSCQGAHRRSAGASPTDRRTLPSPSRASRARAASACWRR
jgi:hypothetical protein